MLQSIDVWMERNVRWLVIGIIGVYTLSMGVVSMVRYWTFQTFYFDFGIFDAALWQVSRFQSPIVDKGMGKIIFADHFNPSLFLLTPVYWIWDRSELLLIIQALVVGISAWLGYLVVKRLTENAWVCVALVVSYLGFVGMQNALITDFHPATLVVLPVMAWFWCVCEKRWRWFWLLLVVILGCKESFAGLVIGLGLFLLIAYKGRHWRRAVGVITLGLLWGLLATKVVIPWFNDGVYAYTPTGLTPSDLLVKLVDGDTKRETLWYGLASFGFLPLLSVSMWGVIYEHFLERFVLSSAATRWDLGLHYNAVLSPLYLVSSALVIKKWKDIIGKRWLMIGSLGLMAWVGFYHQFVYHGPFNLAFNRAFYSQLDSVQYQYDFVSLFPKEGLVMAQNDLAVRLTHGPDVRLLREEYWRWSPDYVILNLTPGQNGNAFFPLTYEQAVALKDALVEDNRYALQKMHDEQYLFVKRG